MTLSRDIHCPPPAEILSISKSGRNKFTGNRYYVPAFTIEKDYFDFDDGMEILYIVMNHPEIEDIVDVISVSLISSISQPGWSDVEGNQDHIFYFEYIEYDGDLQMHYVKYESHEPYDIYG